MNLLLDYNNYYCRVDTLNPNWRKYYIACVATQNVSKMNWLDVHRVYIIYLILINTSYWLENRYFALLFLSWIKCVHTSNVQV